VQKELITERFCTLDVGIYEKMNLDKHFLAEYNKKSEVNLALEIICIIKRNRKFLPLKQFLHEESAIIKIEEEIKRRAEAETTENAGGELPKKNAEIPQGILEPTTWDTVKDTDMFILEEIGGNTLLENAEADSEWKATFNDPLSLENSNEIGTMEVRPSTMHLKESNDYTKALNYVPNLENMLPVLHIQSSKFDPKAFIENMHKNTPIDLLKKGTDLLANAEAVAGESGKDLIMQNVHHFAMSKRVLEEINNSMFSQKAQPQNIHSMIKEAKENFHTFASKIKRYLDPIKKKTKDLEDLDKDMTFIQSLDDFFELNAQIVQHIENQDIKKFVEYYKEYERKIQSYKSLTQVSALVEKVEFIVKKAKSLILTKLLEEDKVSFEKLEESLKYLRELGASNVLIMPLLSERKNRLLQKINETIASQMQGQSNIRKSQQDLKLSINLLKNKDQNEQIDDGLLREKVKMCIDVQEPVDSFINYIVGKKDSRFEYKIDETYINGLLNLGKEIVEEVKIINQIVSVYASKSSPNLANQDKKPNNDKKDPIKPSENDENEISTFKIFGEIIIYLCSTVEKVFLKEVTKDMPYNTANKSISAISQITRMTVFPQDSLLFGDRTFAVAHFIADLERQLLDLIPNSLMEKLNELSGKFVQAYVNKIYYDMYTNMDKLDLKADLTLATLARNEEPLFMNEFKSMVFEAIEDIAKFMDKMRKNVINSKTIVQALKMPLQNIIIRLLVLIYNESEDLVKRIKQQQQLTSVNITKTFEFDENVFFLLFNGFKSQKCY